MPRLASMGVALLGACLLWTSGGHAQVILLPCADCPPETGLALPVPSQPAVQNVPGGYAIEQALFEAVSRGDLAACRELVERGARVDARDATGLTPLAWAAQRGRTEIARLLLLHGAARNPADGYGFTPLMWSAQEGHTELVALLLAAGANPRVSTEGGVTALALAQLGHHAQPAALIRSALTGRLPVLPPGPSRRLGRAPLSPAPAPTRRPMPPLAGAVASNSPALGPSAQAASSASALVTQPVAGTPDVAPAPTGPVPAPVATSSTLAPLPASFGATPSASAAVPGSPAAGAIAPAQNLLASAAQLLPAQDISVAGWSRIQRSREEFRRDYATFLKGLEANRNSLFWAVPNLDELLGREIATFHDELERTRDARASRVALERAKALQTQNRESRFARYVIEADQVLSAAGL
ncbi:MAG: ankyrin repeat domain-containing protein [Candidatus Sericytochromatia bacterium]|nr:ankyrin repeat domain-containing protein [Candidatus Sericytochromatia bacterium]